MTSRRFLLKSVHSLIALGWTALLATSFAQPLPRSSPEAEGVSSAAVSAFVEAADQEVNTMHSFMLLRHGKVIAEGWWKPESAEKPHVLWSLSKSFTATAVGFAAAEGKLSVDDPVTKFFPAETPADASENLKAMRVRDLLSMSGGHDTEPKFKIEDGPSVKEFFAHPVTHAPGTWFRYNTPGSYLLSAIVTKATGQTVLNFLKPRLFEPLGIENPEWGASTEGHSLGGYGLFLRTEDIAKFGQLYLQRGKWNGRQLLPEKWIEDATSKQVDNDQAPSGKNPDWRQGYGYQFWRCQHGAIRGDGADGQFCIVLPAQDAVISITAFTNDMQSQLNLVWDKLLPAFQPAALAPNPDEEARLKQILANLTAREGKGGMKAKPKPAAAMKAIETVTNTPGLVAFWTFGEDAGTPRFSTGTTERHPLAEVGGPIARVEGGPFSGYSADLNGKQYFSIPYAETGDLNIAGPEAQVSMFAAVRIVNLKQSRTIAGMWSEGKGANDDTGTRQYALLMNMPTYGGPRQLVPHISSEGGVTRRADGSAFPWCADYAATKREVPEEKWCTVGFTYDGKYLRAYLDGVLDVRALDPVNDKRTDPYFTKEGPNGGDRGMNPYFHGRGIYRYDPAKHATTKPGGGSDFTVGARYAVGKMLGEATIGRFGGLAVFNRALSEAEMKMLHEAANVTALP